MPAHAPAPILQPKHAVLTGKLMRKAEAHQAAGRLDEAERQYARCVELDAGHGAAHYQLGLLARARGEPARAVTHLVSALRSAPGHPPGWIALASALIDDGRLAEARAVLERFLSQGFAPALVAELRKPLVRSLYAKGLRLFEAERFEEAETFVDAIILLDETHADAVNLAGNIAGRLQRQERAIELLTIAVYLDNANAGYFSNLGVAFSNAGNEIAALAAFEKALELDPDNGVIESNLAYSYLLLGRLQDALSLSQAIAARRPRGLGTQNNIASLLQRLGRTEEAIAAYRRVLAIDPGAAFAHTNLIQAQLYSAELSPEACFETARDYGRRHADPLLRTRPFPNEASPERRLRIGFVSADLRDHPVSRFIEPFLGHYDRARFETFAYSSGVRQDAITQGIRARIEHWRDIAGLDDEAAADLIEADRIDILVDLAGHTGDHRLLVFARKPAPVQATWIGLPVSTGLASIDYRLSDANSEPEGTTDHLHSERLWRLPGTAFCYAGHPASPEPAAQAPFERNGHLTFGCVNRPEKVGRAVLETWARILERVPDARMVFVVENVEDRRTHAALERRFAEAGLPLARIDFAPFSAQSRHDVFARIDVALDPFPFNGVTTSFDTLYMGVPYIALQGGGTVSRMGAAILRAAGLPELAATDTDHYVALAGRLAADPDRLRRIRSGLRQRLQASVLMDHARHATEVGEAFAAMWRLWCEAQPGA